MLDNNEIIIVTGYKSDDSAIACAFSDRQTGMYWFKKLQKNNIPASISAVELNSGKDFLLEFDL